MPLDRILAPANRERYALGVLRIVTGVLFLEHGLSKLAGFPHNPALDQLTLMSLPGLAGTLELFGGALVAAGLFTRVTAFVLSGEMAVAYFMAHAPRGFFPVLNGGDAAILFCFVFLFIFVTGPGALSLDGIRTRGDRVGAGSGQRTVA